MKDKVLVDDRDRAYRPLHQSVSVPKESSRSLLWLGAVFSIVSWCLNAIAWVCRGFFKLHWYFRNIVISLAIGVFTLLFVEADSNAANLLSTLMLGIFFVPTYFVVIRRKILKR